MANLSDHDLKQIDAAWLEQQPEAVLRRLAGRLLEDLKAARDRLNQGPGNSSRPPGSMDPWQRGAGKSEAADAAGAARDVGPGPSDVPAADAACGQEGQAPSAAPGGGPADATKAALMADEGLVSARQQRGPAGRPGRRLGAPGHGRQQKLRATRIEEHRPSCCAACGQRLDPEGALQAWSGWETLELVPLGASHEGVLGVRIEVTRHLLMQQRCACGHTSRAQARRARDDGLWPGVAISEQRLLGANLAAAVVHLCVRMRLPRRKVQELLQEWFGLQLSVALIDQTVHQAARSVEPLQAQLVEELEKSALVHADETSWMEAGQALWLWVLCCGHTVLYMIGARTKEMFNNGLASAFEGVLMSDGYTAYRDRGLRLRCWAHLARKLRGVAESTDAAAARAGAQMLQAFEGLMGAIYEARARREKASQGPHAQAGDAAASPAVTHATGVEQLRQLCEQHRDAGHKALREVVREFLNDWEAIMRVLDNPELPLTNNFAERQLRHYVIARRISYGTRTLVGSQSVALLASIIDTCRLRNASATQLLAQAIHAARTGVTPPRLPDIPAASATHGLHPLAPAGGGG